MVADNGIGFTPRAPNGNGAFGENHAEGRIASGNGLDNMIQRLQQVGGRCVLDSAPGEGTRVRFTVRIAE